MSILFTPANIHRLSLKNRFIRSATFTGLARPDGFCTPEQIQFLTRLAKGGVGLIITGYTYVHKEGQAGPRQLGIDHDDFIPSLRNLTTAVHDDGGKIVLQLADTGAFSRSTIPDAKPRVVSSGGVGIPATHRELTVEELPELAAAFGRAAARAEQAGFDGVQLHAAHGYLLSQFLSPLFNHRADAYGGELKNRVRFLLDVVQAIRIKVAAHFPLLVKINSEDFTSPGLALDESLAVGRMLEQSGVDALEISGGLLTTPTSGPSRTGIKTPEQEGYFGQAALAFKKQLQLPIITVGGIRSFDTAERLVKEGYADFIALSRPFICEPELVQRWQQGDTRPAFCVSDNLCFRPAMAGKGVHCVTAKRMNT
jgi:2,4-dienoyl-CoA reductase-like NADH-dependent reductase (Old Yellow Enzyme family)